MEARKLKEAEACMAAGAKLEKTGVFSRWKPDWESAAAEYEKAATSFRVAKAPDRAVDAYLKAANAHQRMDVGTYMAAKHLESAAFILRDLKCPAEAADLYERASALHRQEGRVDQAADALTKGARTLEEVDNGRAGDLMLRACGLIEDEEDERVLRVGVETFKQATASLLRGKRLADAATVLKKQSTIHEQLQQPHGVSRCELSVVVVCLAGDAFDAAQSQYDLALQRSSGFATSDEAETAERLLSAFTSQDEEGLKACLAANVFRHLEGEVARLVRTLTLRSAGVPIEKLTTAQAAGGGGNAPLPAGAGPQGTGDFGEVAPEDELNDDDLT